MYEKKTQKYAVMNKNEEKSRSYEIMTMKWRIKCNNIIVIPLYLKAPEKGDTIYHVYSLTVTAKPTKLLSRKAAS